MAEWTIQPASNFNPGMNGYYLCEGEENVAFFSNDTDAASALITVRTLATEKEALTLRVQELEAIIRDHVPFADHLLEPATDEPELKVNPCEICGQDAEPTRIENSHCCCYECVPEGYYPESRGLIWWSTASDEPEPVQPLDTGSEAPDA